MSPSLRSVIECWNESVIALNQKLWDRDDEISTRLRLYALDLEAHFTPARPGSST